VRLQAEVGYRVCLGGVGKKVNPSRRERGRMKRGCRREREGEGGGKTKVIKVYVCVCVSE
jgi:hypothetical protein